MSQTDFTTAELALHYRGLGAGLPTSEVQKVKRLPSLPVAKQSLHDFCSDVSGLSRNQTKHIIDNQCRKNDEQD